MRPTDREAIHRLPLFEHVSAAGFAALCRAALVQSFPAHVELIQEGALPDFLHVVLDGVIELYSTTNRRETTLALLHPVSTFIFAAVATDQPYLMSARALTPVRVLLMPAEAVRAVLARDVGFARAAVNELATRYREVVWELKSQKQSTATQRLAQWLLLAHRQSGRTGRFRLPFEKRTLASHLGMTPENLSRAFVGLRGHGVHVSGREISFVEPEKLEVLADRGFGPKQISAGCPTDGLLAALQATGVSPVASVERAVQACLSTSGIPLQWRPRHRAWIPRVTDRAIHEAVVTSGAAMNIPQNLGRRVLATLRGSGQPGRPMAGAITDTKLIITLSSPFRRLRPSWGLPS